MNDDDGTELEIMELGKRKKQGSSSSSEDEEKSEEEVDLSSSSDGETEEKKKRKKQQKKKKNEEGNDTDKGEEEEDDGDLAGADEDGEGDGEGESEDLRDRLKKMGKFQGSMIAMHKPTMTTNLEWNNINYQLTLSLPPQKWWKKLLVKIPFVSYLLNTKLKRHILHDVSGKVKAGEFLAILGPTGCGKTTLLNILAGRVKKGVTGEVLINGQKPNRTLRRQTAYVLQDDIFFTNLTVRETLTFTAYLKLPRALSWKEKRQRVNEVVQELNIGKCADTIIGGPFARGVSGGERKRTNIGNELLANPSLILLDEPTSGLDSSTALSLIITLKELAKSGRTVITTIHQPSSAMFQMFDNVLLLADGHIVYYGKASKVVPYFASLGYPCTPHYNPADYMLELVTSDVKTEDGRAVKEVLADAYTERKGKKMRGIGLSSGNIEEEKTENVTGKKAPKYPTLWLPQFFVLMRRAFKQHRGDALTGLALAQVLFIAIISGILWLQVSYTEDAITDRTGYIFFAAVFWLLHPWFQALYSFPPERAVLNKERSSGSYRLSAYFLGKTVSDIPVELLLPFLYITITYWMVGLNYTFQNYIIFLGIIFLSTILGTSMGLALGATVIDTKKAVTFSAVAVLGSMLLGGFYIKPDNMPIWIRWAVWTSPFKYVYEALLICEFGVTNDHTWTNSNPSIYSVNPIRGSDILDQLGVQTHIWEDILVIIGMILVSRLIAYLALRFLNRPKK